MLLGGSRRGRWPILGWAPGEDGPNLRRTTPKSPVRVASGRTRLLPADWAPGGRQRPRNSRGLPESRSRESRPMTRRPLDLTAATAGGATHRPAVRRPDPSALLAGTPIRISRSNRVGPSGRSGIYRGSPFRVTAPRPCSPISCMGTIRACPRNGRSSLSGPARKFVRGPERTSGLRSRQVRVVFPPAAARSQLPAWDGCDPREQATPLLG